MLDEKVGHECINVHAGPITSVEVSIILPKPFENDLLKTILRPPCVTCEKTTCSRQGDPGTRGCRCSDQKLGIYC